VEAHHEIGVKELQWDRGGRTENKKTVRKERFRPRNGLREKDGGVWKQTVDDRKLNKLERPGEGKYKKTGVQGKDDARYPEMEKSRRWSNEFARTFC